MSNSKYRPLLDNQQAKQQPESASQILREKIATRAETLYQSRGGGMIKSMQYTIGLVLQDFTNQMLKRVEAGDGAKPMVTPYVALRYMRENKALEAERLMLLDECLAIAKQELDTQPVDPANLLGNKIEKIIAEAIASPKIEKAVAEETKPVLLIGSGATYVEAAPESTATIPAPIQLE